MNDVTVVIPAWNLPKELEQALQSFETHAPNARVVVIDNASDDDLAVPEGVEVHRLEKRMTVGAARNYGLTLVDTAYVMFFDADEELCAGGLDALKLALDHNPDAAMATGLISIEQSDGSHVPKRLPHATVRRVMRRVPATGPYFEALRFACAVAHVPVTGVSLHRTEQLRSTPGYVDANYGEDVPLSLSVCSRGQIEFLEEAVKRIPPKREGSLYSAAKEASQRATARRLLADRIASDPGVPRPLKRMLPLYRLTWWVREQLRRWPRYA